MAGYPQPRKWTPKHPEKYEGDPTNIIARSSWEIKFFNWCDHTPSILEWSSEECQIKYICGTDSSPHTYYPDAKIKYIDNKGQIKTALVEIKPKCQTIPPVPSKKKSYSAECMTFIKNQSKWKYAKEFCRVRGWEFSIITEEHLGISTRSSR